MEKREAFSTWVHVWQLQPPWRQRFVSAGLNWLSELPQTTLHKRPSHISAVIWTGGKRYRGEKKKCNYHSLFVCHLFHVWRQKKKKHRAALVLMTTPKTNFPLSTTDTGVQDPIMPNHARLSKPLDITCYYSLPSLRFNKSSSIRRLAPRPQSSNYITSSCLPVSRLFVFLLTVIVFFSLSLKKELDKDEPRHPH